MADNEKRRLVEYAMSGAMHIVMMALALQAPNRKKLIADIEVLAFHQREVMVTKALSDEEIKLTEQFLRTISEMITEADLLPNGRNERDERDF